LLYGIIEQKYSTLNYPEHTHTYERV
jgi:hypothetical protein